MRMNVSRSSHAALIVKLAALSLAVAGLGSLGAWQLHRGMQKKALVQAYEAALHGDATVLGRTLAPPTDAPRPVRLAGIFAADRQLLLDNQVHDEQPGYDVWTPLRLDDGSLAIVDRGWITHAQGAVVPAPAAQRIELRGLWKALPAPALRLQTDNCAPRPWPRVVEYPTADDLRCLLGETPIAGVVLLDAAAPDGFVRDWNPSPGFPPERHYAYALQWFALAATLLILSLRMLLKR
jgi:cytochrome oxidase assembly protein ShyY1